MEKASLDQGKQILELFSRSSAEVVQRFLENGDLIGILLRSPNIRGIDRDEFCRFVGVHGGTLIVDYKVRTVYFLKMLKIDLALRDEVVKIDLSKVRRISALTGDESEITGHEYLKRLQDNRGTLLDVRVLEEFMRNEQMIPCSWRQQTTYFFGTIGDRVDSGQCVPSISFYRGGWTHFYRPLYKPFGRHDVAACLPEAS